MRAKMLKEKKYGTGEVLSKNQIIDLLFKDGKWVVKSKESHIYLSLSLTDFAAQ